MRGINVASTMKLSVSSYSLCRVVNAGRMDLFEEIDWVAKAGFAAIEFSGFQGQEDADPGKVAKKLKARCKKRGLAIASYTIGADLLKLKPAEHQAEIERVKGEVDVAAILGVKRMRHDAARGFPNRYRGPKDYEDALPYLVPACREIADYAAEKGITTSIENHGYFVQHSTRVLKLVRKVNRPNFGVTVDLGNFLCADDDPVAAVRRLARYASHVHVKDFHVKSADQPNPGEGWFQSAAGNYLRGAIVGHGNVQVVRCLSLLKKAGYAGYLSIEFEGLEEPLKAVEIGRDNLRRYLRKL